MIYIMIPNEWLNELNKSSVSNKKWKKFMILHFTMFKEIYKESLSDAQLKLLEKLKELAQLTLKKEIRFGIYQVFNYLFADKNAELSETISNKKTTSKPEEHV